MKKLDLVGKTFTRLTVVAEHGRRKKKVIWKCLCECGKPSFAQTSDLTSGKHRSCGCLHIDTVTTHGHASDEYSKVSPTYRSWASMISRCTNPKATHSHRYGGRGIKICKRWLNFTAFLADMGERPSLRYTIERNDNDGDYEPSNCRWATRKEQAQNRIYTPPRVPRKRSQLGRFI